GSNPHVAARDRLQCHLAVERRREDLVDITLSARDGGAIRQDDANRWQVRAAARRLNEGGPEIEEARPLPGVLGTRDLAIGAVHQSVGTIAAQPPFRNLGGVQLLAHRWT